jgi:hypothetical protein
VVGEAERLAGALVAVYRPYVLERMAELGLEEPDGLEAALQEGEAWLRANLGELLALPFGEQRRGPLEVFQEAMRFPTAALEAAGASSRPRDPTAEAALPGDRYDLAPASSRALGEEVWRAHLVWGAAKAGAIKRPPTRPAMVHTDNLLDRTRIEAAMRAAGYAPGDGADPVVAVVDLESKSGLETVRALAGRGVRVVAYGPHVDRAALERATRAGAALALPRSQLFRTLAEVLAEP